MTTKTKKSTPLVEPVKPDSFTLQHSLANTTLTNATAGFNNEKYGVSFVDRIIFDKLIKPQLGDIVGYQRGKNHYIGEWTGEKPKRLKTYKQVGVMTHVLKCVYKHPDDILNAESLTLEVSE